MVEKHFPSTRPRVVVLLAALAVISFALFANAGQDEAPAVAEEAMDASEALVRLWSHSGIFEKVTQAGLGDDALFVSGAPRGLDVVDLRKGKSAWRHVGESLIDQPATVLGDVVYVVEGAEFVTLDRQTGKELSRSKTRVGTLTPLYPRASDWVVASTNQRVYGIVPDTGLGNWHTTLSGGIVDAAWDGRSILYVRTQKGYLYAVSAGLRNTVWKTEMPRADCSKLTLHDSVLHIGCADYFLYMVDTETGEILSRICLNAPVYGKPVVAGSRVYVTTSDDVLHAVETEENAVAWTIDDAERVLTTTEERVIFLRKPDAQEGYSIGVADIETGEVLTTASARRYTHFAANPTSGVFYAISKNGDVLAIADRETAERAREQAKQAVAE